MQIEQFIKTPQINDIVKVYAEFNKITYGIVVGYSTTKTTRKGFDKREVVKIKECQPHETNEIDFFLTENKIVFVN